MTLSPGVEPVALTVDIVLLTIRDDRLHVLLVERGAEPFAGTWALPGGFVQPREELALAAHRELVEETGLDRSDGHLEQLRTYAAPDRDPRGRVVSVAHLGLIPDLPAPVAGSDGAGARWWPVDDLGLDQLEAVGPDRAATDPTGTERSGTERFGTGRPDGAPALAFDHERIVSDGVERARAKLEYTTLATSFVGEPFTLGDLRSVYEAVWGVDLDTPNFRRKVLSTPGFVVDTGERVSVGRGKPAALYRRGPARDLHPAMLRPSPETPARN